MKKLMTLIAVLVLVSGCTSTGTSNFNAAGELDYGDFSSQTLTTKAWDALNGRDYMTAIKYTQKCVELYETAAREMQALLREQPPSGAEKTNDQIHANWALNDVGTSYYIRAEAFMELGREDDALMAYRKVMDQFYFAQTWDPKGWFWSPADAASTKVATLAQDF